MRLARKVALQVKPETTYRVNPGSWSGTDMVLLREEPRFRVDRQYVDRKLVRGYLGGSDQLVAWKTGEIDYEFELAPSGTAGTAPPWGRLLRLGGMAESITAGTMVEYTPVSDNFTSATFRYFADGVMFVAVGAYQNIRLKLEAGDLPFVEASLRGLDTNASAVTLPTSGFSAWQKPFVINDENTADIRLGCSYNTSTGAISGGVNYTSKGLQIDFGNEIPHQPLLGSERIVFADREITGQLTLDLSAADEVAWRTNINTNVETTLGWVIGGSVGNRLTIFAPRVQFIDPRLENLNGQRLIQSEVRFLPVNGNDEIRIVSR